MLRLTVLYPAGTGFDWDYYTTSHLALVEERFGPHLARAPEVARGVATLPDGAPTYVCVATMYFADRPALDAALRAGGRDVPGDIPNFTDARPVMQVEELVS